jgi:hypothetical protein
MQLVDLDSFKDELGPVVVASTCPSQALVHSKGVSTSLVVVDASYIVPVVASHDAPNHAFNREEGKRGSLPHKIIGGFFV